jgi:hypothetical protein
MNGAQLTGGGQVAFNPGTDWKIADTGNYDGVAGDEILWRGPAGDAAMWFMDGVDLLSGGLVPGIRPGPEWAIIA